MSCGLCIAHQVDRQVVCRNAIRQSPLVLTTGQQRRQPPNPVRASVSELAGCLLNKVFRYLHPFLSIKPHFALIAEHLRYHSRVHALKKPIAARNQAPSARGFLFCATIDLLADSCRVEATQHADIHVPNQDAFLAKLSLHPGEVHTSYRIQSMKADETCLNGRRQHKLDVAITVPDQRRVQAVNDSAMVRKEERAPPLSRGRRYSPMVSAGSRASIA
jgi:hypothetical protein